MILVLAFLLAPSVMAETQSATNAKPSAEEFLDAKPKKSNVDEVTEMILGPEAAEALKRNPAVQAREQACRKSKTELEKYENCWLSFIRDTYRQHPSDLVELLIARLKLIEKKRLTKKIGPEEADVLRREAHAQFDTEVSRRESIARQEERANEDRDLQLRVLERDAKQREANLRWEKQKADWEERRRQLDEEERKHQEFLRSTRPPTQTDCYRDPVLGSIHCTTR